METKRTGWRRGWTVAGILAAAACLWTAPSRADEGARRILAGDRLNISVEEQADLSRVYAVAGDGTIDFAFAGRVLVAEMTEDEAAAKLKAILEKDYFNEAHVGISIANFVEGDVLVQGEVANPGVLAFRGDSLLTVMEAVLRSGGLTDRAAGNRVQIVRWVPGGRMERETILVDLEAILAGDFSQDQYLRPRDTVMVPRRGDGEEEASAEYLAMGEVVHPGFYPYRANLDIIKAVTQFGGMGEFADWEAGRILRKRPGGDYSVIPVDLGKLFSTADMSLNMKMQPGDIIFVPSTRNQVRQQVYLLGEVPNPGAVPITAGPDATVARMILSRGGATEFGYPKSVRVLRTGPTGAKKAVEVNVQDILERGDFDNDLPLQDGDVIIVPEKTLWRSVKGLWTP